MHISRVVACGLAMLSAWAYGDSYFTDFSSSNLSDWTFNQGVWAVENGYLHGTGKYVNGRIWNCGYLTNFVGTDVSVQADMHSDDGYDDVNKMLVLRYIDKNNFIEVNFVAGYRHQSVVEMMKNGQRSQVTPSDVFEIPDTTQLSWHHCRADLVGDHVLAYFDGELIMDTLAPALYVRSGHPGVTVYSSPGGGDEEVFLDNYSAANVGLFEPSSVSMSAGRVTSGALIDLAEADDFSMSLIGCAAPTVGGAKPGISMVSKHYLTFPLAAELTLRFLGTESESGLRRDLQLYNWNTNAWETLDSRPTYGGKSASTPRCTSTHSASCALRTTW